MIQGWAFGRMSAPNKVAPTMLPSKALLAPVGFVMLALSLLIVTPVIERLEGLSALDGVAHGYADDMGNRTFTLFLAVKSMNVALSVLEPADDLIEQLSVARSEHPAPRIC